MGGKIKALFTYCLLCCETLSLAFFCIPQVLSWIGLVPSVILINSISLLQWYTGFTIFRFCVKHEEQATSMSECLRILFGTVGYYIGVLLQVAYMVFVVAAHIEGFESAFGYLSAFPHSDIVYRILGMLLIFGLAAPKTMGAIKWFYAISFLSFMISLVVGLVGVAKKNPQHNDWFIFTPLSSTSAAKVGEAIGFFVVATMAQNAYPTIISEMGNDKQQFKWALGAYQITSMFLLNLFAVLFYIYAGQNIQSPAMASAVEEYAKIAYGTALPTIVLAAVIAQMVASKESYQFIFQLCKKWITDERKLHSWTVWLLSSVAISAIALGIAFGIPKSNQVFSLIGAVVGVWYALGIPSMLWFHQNLDNTTTTIDIEGIDLRNARSNAEIEEKNEPLSSVARSERSVSDPESLKRTSKCSNGTIPSTNAIINYELPSDEIKNDATIPFCSRLIVRFLSFCRKFSILFWKKKILTLFHVFMFILCIVIGVLGTYGAAEDIKTNGHQSYEVLG